MSDSTSVLLPIIRVEAMTAADQLAAEQWAQTLGLPLAGAAEFALQVGVDGLQLQELSRCAPGPLRVDFIEGALAHRRQFGGGSGQMIAKAVGIQAGCSANYFRCNCRAGARCFCTGLFRLSCADD